MGLIMTSIVFLVFLQNLHLSRTSQNEEPEWFQDVLQLGSRNGNPSLKAAIVPYKNNAQGRSLTRQGKGRLSTNLSPSGGDDGGTAFNSDMKQPTQPQGSENVQNSQKQYEGPKVTIDRHYDEDEFEDVVPNYTMMEHNEKDKNKVGEKIKKIKISGRAQNRNSNNIFVPLKEQQTNSNDNSMVNIVGDSAGQLDHLSIGNPYFYPIQANRLARWKNQENVLVGAYKKLTNINRERLHKVNGKGTN